MGDVGVLEDADVSSDLFSRGSVQHMWLSQWKMVTGSAKQTPQGETRVSGTV